MAKTKKMSAFRAKAAAVLARAGRSKRPRAATVFQKTFTGPEVKYLDKTISTAFDTTGNPTFCNGVQEGSDNINRIGRQYKIIAVMMKGFVVGGTGASTGAQPVRHLVVYDKNSNGSTPTIGDVLINGDVTGQLNLDNKDRFVVLWDEIWQPPGAGLGPDASSAAYWAINKWRKVRLPVICNGTGGTASNYNTGAIFSFTIGRFAAAVTNPVIQINFRTKFTDD